MRSCLVAYISVAIAGLSSALLTETTAAAQTCQSGVTCTEIDSSVQDFFPQPFAPNGDVYVLSTNGNLWLEFGSASSRSLIDSSVAQFQPIDGATIYVLSTNGNLWNETNSASTRSLVDTSVGGLSPLDSSNVYVKLTTGTLWIEHGNSGGRTEIDSSVARAQGINQGFVDVLASNGVLWSEFPGGVPRVEVDSSVSSFEAVPTQPDIVYVLSTNGNLWNEDGTGSHRTEVDSSVIAFSPVDSRVVYVVGSDNKLWRENGSGSSRIEIMTGIKAVKAVNANFAYALTTGNLLFEVSPPTLSNGLALGPVDLQQYVPGGPAVCTSGSGFTPNAAISVTYTGVPGQNTQGPFAAGSASSTGTFSFGDASQESKRIVCSASEIEGLITVTATDGTLEFGGTGNAVSTTISTQDWCSNAVFSGSGTCDP